MTVAELRTWNTAHHYIIEHWRELESGAVVDVQFVLGKTNTPKTTDMR
jgi:hypothetical protein